MEIIDEGAFAQCPKLKEIKFPNSLKVLGSVAFEWCNNIEKITFGKNSQLKKIGSGCFYGCPSLTKITIPKKVKEIGEYAFEESKNLKVITFKGKAPKIGKDAFEKISAKAMFKVQKKYKSAFRKKLKKKTGYKFTMAIR